MQSQQQLPRYEKNGKKPFQSERTSFVSIEQIYEVDTITLEELVQQFQQQSFYKHISSSTQQHKNLQLKQISQKFTHLPVRQLKKWYHLAKMELKQRQKIQLFALKLIHQDIQPSDHCFETQSFKIQLPQKTLIKVNQNQEKMLDVCPPILNLHKQSINLKSPLIHSQNHVTQLSSIKHDNSKPKPQIFNLNQMKTLQVKSFNTNTEKDKKILSKKDFLQMMKMKLNKGTDYKTGAFINQPLKKSHYYQSKKKFAQQVQKRCPPQSNSIFHGSKMKSNSAYLSSNIKIDNLSNMSTKQVPIKKLQQTQKLKGRYKTQSSYATSRQQGTSSIPGSNNFNKKDVKSINKAQTSRTAPVSRMEKQFPQRAILIQKEDNDDKKSRIKIIDQNNTSQTSTNLLDQQLDLQKGQKNEVNCKELMEIKIQKQDEQKCVDVKQSLNLLDKKQSNDTKIQQPSITSIQNTSKVEKQNLDSNFPLFVQNEDAYDDEPQVLQAQIVLQKEENTYSRQQHNPSKFIQNQLQCKNHNLTNESVSKQSQLKDEHQLIQLKLQICDKKQQDNQILQSLTSISFKTDDVLLLHQKEKPIKQKHHPYHLQFPTFYHLFHTVKPQNASANNNKFSMPYLLKSIEISLQSYFKKQVLTIARSQLQSKMALSDANPNQSSQNDQDQPNIELKCITQLQFINSFHGSTIFDVDLSSFKEKSTFLMKKLRNNNFFTEYSASKLSKRQQQYDLKQKYEEKDPLFYRVVRNKPQVYDIINTSFYRTQNWLELPRGMELQGCWNLLWTWSKPQIDFNSLIKFQKVNHFPGSKELARKDLLKKNIEKIKKLSKKLHDYFDIIPDTYFLPGQNLSFIKKFRQSQNGGKNLWILKPVGLSRGRGISLVNRLQDVVFSEPIVMQKYIHNPYLLDGYKFDLRIYVLVTSMNPLQCFVYKEGFARVSTQKYCNDVQEIDNKYVHLTNYSIQKDSMKSPGIFTQREKSLGGCKLTLRMLRQRLGRRGVEWQRIWAEIKEVILKSLISCMKYIPQNPNCFELFGYDIMLDSELKCWLIEVNSSPSLQQDFLIDQIVKQQLIDDTIEVVDPIHFNREELLKVIKRRRREVEGMKSHVNYANNSIDQLNQDLDKILYGKALRNYGEVRQHVNFECLAPGNLYQKMLKTVQHYTHDPFVKSSNFY